MIRALLVDDEESALRWLGDLLSSQPGIAVAGTATNVRDAEALLDTLRPDVVFLDISMPRHGGMTLLASAGADLRIVLVTAHDDRTLEAFEHGAFDYILKPVTAARLKKTVDRLRRTLRPPPDVAPVAAVNDRLTVSTPTGTTLIPVDQILWVEARQNYSLIRRRDGGSVLVKRLLGDFGEELPSRIFARVGRSLVVNLGSLRRISRAQGNGAVLEFADTSETLLVGRAATARIRQLLAPREPPESPSRRPSPDGPADD